MSSDTDGTPVKAVSQGTRSLGRSNITTGHEDVTVPFHRTDGTPPIFAGFKIGWFDGTTTAEDGRTIEYDMCAGAGMGSKYLTLSVKIGDVTTYEYVDMAEVFEGRVNAILAEHGTKEAEDGQ